jgi:hypothetical protein
MLKVRLHGYINGKCSLTIFADGIEKEEFAYLTDFKLRSFR